MATRTEASVAERQPRPLSVCTQRLYSPGSIFSFTVCLLLLIMKFLKTVKNISRIYQFQSHQTITVLAVVVFTRKPGGTYRRRFRSVLLCFLRHTRYIVSRGVHLISAGPMHL